MLIVCPTCASEFNVDAAHLGSEGRRVRCFNCNSDWFARPVGEDQALQDDPLDGKSAQDFIDDEWQRAAADDAGIAQPAQDQATQDQAGPETEAADPSAEDTAPAAQDGNGPEPQDSGLQVLGPQETGEAERPPSSPPAASPDAGHPRRRKAGQSSRSAPKSAVRSGPRPLSGTLAICGAVLIGLCLWQRDVMVRYAPALAGPLEKAGLSVNIRGLEFDKVASELVSDPSGRFLVVQSMVRNVTSRQVFVPQIEVVVRDASGKPIYTWAAEPPKPSLAPGETLSFRTRLGAPPQDGHDVMLRFQRGSGQMKVAQK